ncbi:sn-glycerol-1-phosphate dehydrogenase [Paraliobacillus sp. X-1268]|uniref:sn-glycerol-1-phosphate dehydrogenase n=1 Tax=Paraliobacillus sp. X-1268 TaxID=2213193 RepID=UPI001E4904A2|nr:sn-glycerol-1-phosphate dehydrogenase [Paraliobacillus sp. X-1268]
MEIPVQMHQLMKEVGVEDIVLPELMVEKKALLKIAPFLKANNLLQVVLVVDQLTYKAAGQQLEKLLENEKISYKTVLLKENQHGQVLANEEALVQLLVETPSKAQAFLAVGSGTIHDTVRFVSNKMEKPFISIPTAASVDGFTSKGAPLILRGVKTTIQTASPLAVFADLDVLVAAPKELTAAGFGDILGKYTSLLDWKISDLIGKEPYYPIAAEMTRQSLETCVQQVEKIATHDEEGIKLLIQALIESGLVMLILDFSRPASGGEHHLSHYWEMILIRKDAKQLLHGAKVGVATAIISDLYKQMANQLELNDLNPNKKYTKELIESWSEIKLMIDELPSAKELRNMLDCIGGPSTTDALGLSDQLIQSSLNEAQHIRDRCTGLLLVNNLKQDTIKYPIEKLNIKR